MIKKPDEEFFNSTWGVCFTRLIMIVSEYVLRCHSQRRAIIQVKSEYFWKKKTTRIQSDQEHDAWRPFAMSDYYNLHNRF